MNNFIKMVSLIALTLFATIANAATDLNMSGQMSWETLNNQTSVRIMVAQITNQTSNTTSGTIHIRMRATTSPDLFGPGYTLADVNMGSIDNDPIQPGQLGPGESYTNITATVSFTPPPSGTYYTHFYISEFPDLNTVLDSFTFSNTAVFGSVTPPPAGDDHGNSFGNATTISPNSSRNGRLEVNGDQDMFRVTVQSAGTLRLATTGSTDTVGTLYNASQVAIAQNDDSTDVNFVIEESVAAGTYYIKVGGFNDTRTGNYTLFSDFISSSVPPPVVTPPVVTEEGGGGSLGFVTLLLLLATCCRRRTWV